MDVEEVKKSIKRVIKKHRQAFEIIGKSQTKLLELGAIAGVAEHYKACGYETRVLNPKGKSFFSVKTSTRGFPWNFSRIVIEKESVVCELHMNLMVVGACGVGTYCVDVGIVAPDKVPQQKPKEAWKALENNDLISFAEVKKLVVYPMLLAQFLGIVHEIKPKFLSSRDGISDDHPSPVLIVLGHYSANAHEIVANYKQRGIFVTIAANFDGRLAKIRSGLVRSPFYVDEEQL